MKIIHTSPHLILEIDDFSLRDTLDCGQCFGWLEQPDGSFTGVHQGHLLRTAQTGRQVTFFDTSEADFHQIWKPYFDLEFDYAAVKKGLAFHKTLKASADYAGGIRIVRQDPWETTISFIVSQNNNIPRIKGILSRLREQLGTPLGNGMFAFPDAETVAALTAEDLSVLRAGFRTKYIMDAAQKVTEGTVDLSGIAAMPLAGGEAELRKIKGVGPKVAQCILLYGYHKADAFPVDTWIKKVLREYFPDGFPEQAKPHAGIAQQYLFHYIRTAPEVGKGNPHR